MINDFRFFGNGFEVHIKHTHEPTKHHKIREQSLSHVESEILPSKHQRFVACLHL